MRSVTWKSEMTPSRMGRTATMFDGVRPTMRFASAPMARIFLLTRSMATTEGSSMTMPRPFDHDQRVGGTEVNADVVRESAQQG